MIKIIFWDSDNTVLNTAENHWQKHVQTLKRFDITLTDDDRKTVYENNGHQNWAWLCEAKGLTVPEDEYLTLIDAWYRDHLHILQIRAGVWGALNLFRDAGLKQAIVSNSRRASVTAAHEAKNTAQFFEFLWCKEDYSARKPSPEPYLSALAKMNELTGSTITPDQCLVIEDDPKGVQSAKNAGMHVIDRPPGDDNADAFSDLCRGYL